LRLLALLLAAALSAAALAQPVYILNVAEAEDWWTNKDFLTTRILELLNESGFNVTVKVIDSIEEWEKLVSEGPEGVVIVNAHGELIPVPPKYKSDWRGFYRDLALLIMYKGWIFVNPVGYGFYYVDYNYTKLPNGEWNYTRLTVGEEGLNVVGGWMGILATAWPPEQGSPTLTDLGRRVFDALGYDMPEGGISARPFTTGYPPRWAFYAMKLDNLTAYSCAAFTAGEGMLVWGGLSADNVEYQAMATAAMLLYILYPEIEMLPPKRRGPSPAQLTLIAWGVMVILGTVIIVSILLKRKGGA